MRKYGSYKNIMYVLEENNSESLTIICSGIPGNRVDGRRVMVKISECTKKCSFLRFDITGMGLSNGKTSLITYDRWANEVNSIIDYFSRDYICINMICFSESAKIIDKLNLDRLNYIIIINGIITEEKIHGPYKPRVSKEDDIWVIYTGFGVNLNLALLNYKYKALQETLLNNIGKFTYIYGTEDDLTKYSRKFLVNQMITYREIKGADHLFTNANQVDSLIKIVGDIIDEK